jgi:ketosteroid isomerase-like protein
MEGFVSGPVAGGRPMSEHPNFTTTQKVWDAIAAGDFVSGLDVLTDDVVVDNGPGSGPWRHLEGKDAIASFAMQFIPSFQGTWKEEGRCVYADDVMSIALVHETGTAPSGDVFDNMAIWVSRFNSDGKVDRIWTTDLGHEQVEEFWRRNPIEVQQ